MDTHPDISPTAAGGPSNDAREHIADESGIPSGGRPRPIVGRAGTLSPMNPRIVLVGFCLLLIAPACVPPEPDPYRSIRYNRETTMGQIQDRGVLVVGVDPSHPPFSSAGSGADPEGFAPDLARFVAEALRVEIRFETATSDELIAAMDGSELDLAFPIRPITEKAIRVKSFTDPYFVGHQRLLVEGSAGIDEVDDLEGKRACSYAGPSRVVELDTLVPQVELTEDDLDGCIAALDSGEVDAVTGVDLQLLERLTPDTRLVGEDITTEGLGAVVTTGANSFARFVSSVFRLAEEDGRWTTSYERWVGSLTGEEAEPPELSVGEAALLNPGSSKP